MSVSRQPRPGAGLRDGPVVGQRLQGAFLVTGSLLPLDCTKPHAARAARRRLPSMLHSTSFAAARPPSSLLYGSLLHCCTAPPLGLLQGSSLAPAGRKQGQQQWAGCIAFCSVTLNNTVWPRISATDATDGASCAVPPQLQAVIHLCTRLQLMHCLSEVE